MRDSAVVRCRMKRANRADILIPTMSGKESADTVRVKAAEITTQERGRLEARWERGHTHLMVGMSTREGRFFAAILSVTHSSRSHLVNTL